MQDVSVPQLCTLQLPDTERFGLFNLVVGIAVLIIAGCSEDHYPDALSPEESTDRMQLREDLGLELYASEPDVVDPVEIVWDKRGRAYVAEMRDSPYEPEPGEARSRVRLIEDTDRDGHIDRSVIFADSVSEVTSVLPWKDGVLVTSAPDIIYLEDTDGDDRVDSREVLFTGFDTEGNSEGQITNLRYGIDNWIYAANTGRAGEITSTRRPEAAPVSVDGKDFRFRLDTGEFEAATGWAQFGQDFDDFGHRFITHNTRHVRHTVVPQPYLDRNPELSDASVRDNINDHGLRMYQQTPTPYWREVRTERRNERYEERGMDQTEYARDHFTGASGGTIYSATVLGEEFRGNLFTGEVAGNLIHRDILKSRGVSFVASRAPDEQDREFLASTDPWFRPVNLAVDPGGYLVVLDMYRKHTEGPEFVPEDLREDMDYYAGDDMGRIYRIVPEEGFESYETPELGDASTAELVELFDHENRWWRLTAQRLILERQDRSVTGRLAEMVRTHTNARARLHALYVLEGLSALNPDLIGDILEDSHPGVREHAVRLAEGYESLSDEIAAMVDDPSKRVAFQVGLSLGEFSGAEVEAALSELTRRYGEDPWIRTAVRSSNIGASLDLFDEEQQE
jgi:putative membrane-bound dehydrogenase-like protein